MNYLKSIALTAIITLGLSAPARAQSFCVAEPDGLELEIPQFGGSFDIWAECIRDGFLILNDATVSSTTLATSTTALQVQIDALGVSTDSNKTLIDALGVSTDSLSTDIFTNGGDIEGVERSLGNGDAFAMNFLVGGSSQIHIAANGNVAVNHQNPQSELTVKGTIQAYEGPNLRGALLLSRFPATSASDLTISHDGALTWVMDTTASNLELNVSSGVLGIHIENTTGNVGIGKITPVTQLDVAGTVTATGLVCTNCISTSDILDSNVTTPKLGTDSVTTIKIIDSAVTTSKLHAEALDPAGNLLLQASGGAVGINQATPAGALEISSGLVHMNGSGGGFKVSTAVLTAVAGTPGDGGRVFMGSDGTSISGDTAPQLGEYLIIGKGSGAGDHQATIRMTGFAGAAPSDDNDTSKGDKIILRNRPGTKSAIGLHTLNHMWFQAGQTAQPSASIFKWHGMDTGSPVEKLDLNADGTLTATGPVSVTNAGVIFTDETGMKIIRNTGNRLELHSGASQRVLMVDDEGIFLGEVVSGAPPSNHTLATTGGAGTDIAGSDLIVQTGIGTGSGESGDLLIKTAPAGGSGSSPNTSILRMMIDGESGNVGIGDATPTAKLDISSDTSVADTHFKFAGLDLADDESVPAETYFGRSGFLEIYSTSGATYCSFTIHGGLNSVTKVTDTATSCDTADTDVKLDVISDGDGTYTIKNRLGAAATFAVRFMGFET